MSYLLNALRRPTSAGRRRNEPRLDERLVLNLPDYDGGAHVRVFVEDTSGRRQRLCRTPPAPRLKLRVADCVNEVNLEFSVESEALRKNAFHKLDTLLGALGRFREALAAEAELYAERERAHTRKEDTCRT